MCLFFRFTYPHLMCRCMPTIIEKILLYFKKVFRDFVQPNGVRLLIVPFVVKGPLISIAVGLDANTLSKTRLIWVSLLK